MRIIDGLPTELCGWIADFLTGYDLFQLSHVDAACLALFSQQDVWLSRFGCTKRAYLLRSSVLFEGLPRGCLYSRHAVATVRPSFTKRFGFQTSRPSFSIDAWFALLGTVGSDGRRYIEGGILIGGQSIEAHSRGSLGGFHAFVTVDSARNLFCSLVDCKFKDEHVASGLKTHKWYHLVISVEGGADSSERVYLNGELLRTRLNVRQLQMWETLTHIQVGTGLFRTRSPPRWDLRERRRDHARFLWYDFRGLVDNLRIWHRPLRAHDVEMLYKSRNNRFVKPLGRTPWFSLRRDLPIASATNPRFVNCTRPCESVALLAPRLVHDKPERKRSSSLPKLLTPWIDRAKDVWASKARRSRARTAHSIS